MSTDNDSFHAGAKLLYSLRLYNDGSRVGLAPPYKYSAEIIQLRSIGNMKLRFVSCGINRKLVIEPF